MERDVHKGTWNKKAPLGKILLLMCMLAHMLASVTPEEQTCPDGDYLSKNGFCCNKCPPGFKLEEDCHGAGLRSNCTPCPEGRYIDRINYHKACLTCKRCKDPDSEISQCVAHRNTICGCKEGYYKSEIDSAQYQCKKCRQCGAGEREKQKCTRENNAVCECIENYYRVSPNSKCEPCKNCTCKDSHPSPPNPSTGVPQNEFLIYIIVGTVAAALASLGMIFVTYTVTKRHVEKKLKSSLESLDISQDSCQHVLINKEPSNNISIKAFPPSPPSDYEPHLPDCVPVEIKIPELIYMVLDLVPVLQVKQLVRSLGVKDTVIEQAELDHRSCREAHYQMLRVWAERGSRARGVLHWPLLQQLLDELRKLHLEQAAKELEINCGFQ